jgi:DNA-binding NarL/FixJ family response regulator
MEAQTILVADGERTARNEVGDVLAGAGYVVRKATSGGQALAMTRADPPQLVLLDLALPDMCGYLVCRVLRDEFGDMVSIILLSDGRTDPLDRTAGLLVGADEYLVRPVGAGELLARIRQLVAPVPKATNGAQAELTQRELDVLRLVAQGRQAPEIGATLGIRPGMIATHVQRLTRKLGVRSPAEAIAWSRRKHLLSIEVQVFATTLLDALGAV